MVKWYYRLLQCVYQIITIKIPNINKDIALQMAFKAINDTAGPDGLVPILLIFNIYPWIVELNTPSLLVI